MLQKRTLLSLSVLVALALGYTVPASADGIVIPNPPICDFTPCPNPPPLSQLAIAYHDVSVEIKDQVAVTHVDQVFRNDNPWTIEGTYVFPIPVDAAVNDFTLWIDGEPVSGEVLSKEQARSIYEDIVRSMRDPALLEYIDRGAVRASIFPIAPGEERRIELEYTQVLKAENGLFHYSYPLNTEKFSTEPLERVSVSIAIESPIPMKAIYSPSHPVDVTRQDNRHALVGYESSYIKPDADFELYFSVTADEIGLNLLTYRDPEGDDPDGFFLLMAAPSIEHASDQVIPKDVIFVLDRSGSMDGEKFKQAQAALHYVLDHLNPEDRFNIISFSTSTQVFAAELQGIENRQAAGRWVDSLSAVGSTDINRALLEALNLASRSRPTILIFLTDGLPTEGVTEPEAILSNARQAMRETVRLFPFGVGYDVDTFLLDSMAQENRGTTSYVTPGQAIDEVVSGFFAKVSLPVLTDLELEFGEVTVFDLYPEVLPDLFAGGQLILLGRYRSAGVEDIQLTGEVDGVRQVFEYPEQRFRSSGGADFLPRLWATRKIGALLNEIRLHGPQEETVAQIVRLSIRYGIVTPYTSYLVTEPMALGAEAQEGIAAQAFDELMAAPTIVSGEKAVGQAAAESEYRSADVAVPLSVQDQDLVKVAGNHAYRWLDGVWVDTSFDPETMQALRVPFLSEAYFELAAAHPEFGMALSIGERVIVVIGQQAYEIVGEDETGDVMTIPTQHSNPSGSLEDEGSTLDSSAPESISQAGSNLSRGIHQTCPGMSMLIGLVFSALFMNKRK